ncbi:MAG TPA: glycosyltransferase family 2 protein [Patescibacteria group bacterium]|nr:glycosyltransferase family 2 protein [Patescibacteria group bacterium]
MQNSQLISIFTVNWNGKKWLNKFFSSLQKQSYKNIELIMVDNNSSDDSVDYVRKKFPQVKIIKNKRNLGLATATKIGVEESKGEIVLFVNNDTWFDRYFVEKLKNFYDNNDYDVLSAVEKRYFNNKQFKCNTTIDPTGSPAYFIPTYNSKKLFYLTVCFLCSKNLFQKTLGTDKDFFMYYEDVDWFWRLSLLGKKFTVVKNCFIHHAGAGSTGEGLKYNTFLWRNQNTLQAIIKNYSTITLFFVIPLYVMQNIFEIALFLLMGKPSISYSYIEGWIFNMKILKKTLRKRAWVQKHRIISDFQIFKKMYFGFGKFLLLKDYFSLSR